jgi:hypothetical protein
MDKLIAQVILVCKNQLLQNERSSDGQKLGRWANNIFMIFGQAQTIWSILNRINMNSDLILNFYSLVNYLFNTGNIHLKIGQIVTEFFNI